MTAAKRIFNIFYGLAMIVCCILMVIYPDSGYNFVIVILDLALIIYGLRLLFYYFTMARFMVGGIATFYKSIVVLDFGLFVFSLEIVPQQFAMLYLIFCFAFSGVVDILRAAESRQLGGRWRYHFFYGLVKLAIAVICLFFLDSLRIMTAVFCIGLLHSAVFCITSAFRKTAIVYVES